MSKCHQKKQKYNACGDVVEEWIHCGNHPDTDEDNYGCYSGKAGGPGTTERPPGLPGYCTRHCKAKHLGWICCQCDPPKFVKREDTGNNDVSHNAADEELHFFCYQCTDVEVLHAHCYMRVTDQSDASVFVCNFRAMRC
jgi:hypothetical protein